MNTNDALNLLNLTGSATQTEIKKAFKAQSLKFHPDRNPVGAQMMIAINAAYEHLKKLGDTVTASEGFTENDYAEELNEVLNKLFALDGLEIEICGNWIWITGDTKPHAKALGRKEGGIGCFYASKKRRGITALLSIKAEVVKENQWTLSALNMAVRTQPKPQKNNLKPLN